MFKRSQKEVSQASQHWYQDKYQHVLTQRNVLALIALVALMAAAVAVLTVLRLAPLKTVEPYLLQINEKTGIAQKVNPISRAEYSSSVAIDRYFASTYIRMRESYNFSILRYNYNILRLMSAPSVYFAFRKQADPNNPSSLAARLGTTGMRDVRINSMNYISSPTIVSKKTSAITPPKIIQARITTVDSSPNQNDQEQQWVVTITFEYANLRLNEAEQMLNPLGYRVTSYQIQREIN